MEPIIELTKAIAALPTDRLMVIVTLAGMALAAFAIYVVHVTVSRQTKGKR